MNNRADNMLPTTVLVVDDDEQFLQTVTRHLKGLNYRAIPINDATTALAILDLLSFHAIVAGLHLPLRQGGLFASAAARIAPDLPVIILTAEDSLRRIQALLNGSRIDAIIPKNCDSKQLDDTISRAIVERQVNRVQIEQETRVIADSLVRALALRDIETESHSRRVSNWTRLLAQAIGLSGTDLFDCELAALLHDVGKIGIADAILHKADKLTDDEWDQVRKHPAYGRDILNGISFLNKASEIVYCHHEIWDGQGYPRGLKGNDIPVGARLLTIVDSYDAMMVGHAYRTANNHAAAVAEIRRFSGTYYDPALVPVFEEQCESDHWKSIAETYLEINRGER